jgi:hypothetical protein
VLRGHAGDFRRPDTRLLPPVELDDRPPNVTSHPERRDVRRRLPEQPQRRRLQVIVVIVADEDDINRRQIAGAIAGG